MTSSDPAAILPPSGPTSRSSELAPSASPTERASAENALLEPPDAVIIKEPLSDTAANGLEPPIAAFIKEPPPNPPGDESPSGTSLKDPPNGEEQIEYRTYPMRYFALFTLATLGTSNTLNWNTFAPAASVAAVYYNTSVSTINWLGTTIYISLVVTGLFSAYVIDTRGLRVALICGAVLNGIGTWIRYFGTFSPNPSTALAFAFLGQVMVGIGRPFATSCTTRLAATWFGLEERTFANTLATVSPSFGIITSSAATSYIITEPSRVPLALLIWSCWAIIPTVLVWFVPEKPPTPPSPSAAVMGASKVGSLDRWKKSFKTAFTSVDYLTLWMLMSGQLSLFFIYLVLVQSLLLPYGFTSNQIGFVFVTIISAGWLALPISKLVDRTGNLILAMRMLLIFCTLGLVGLTLSVGAGLYWAILLCAGVYGYAQFPLLSIVFELAMECTYPHLLPAMSSYLISALAQGIGTVLTPVLGLVANKIIPMWVLTAISGATVVLAFLFRGKSRRRLHDTTVLEKQKVERALRLVEGLDGVVEEGDGLEGKDAEGKGA